jgi:tRNA pseudouridine38-40 synthase
MHFDLHHEISVDHLEHVLNRLLPNDVQVYNISLMYNHTWDGTMAKPGEIFHATGSATGKLYSYRFYTGKMMDPLRRRYCAHVYRPINMTLFAECLTSFPGTHDFKAFTNRVEHTAKEFEGKTVEYSTIKTVCTTLFL